MNDTSRDIAIVGVGCRYPDAKGPQELWENVLGQRRAFRRIPEERLRLEDFYAEGNVSPDTIYSKRAAVIEGYEFDQLRFRIGERSFRSADLTHWLALDIAARALEDAGFPDGDGLDRDGTGVLLGNTLTGEFSRAYLMRLRWPYVNRQVGAALAAEGWDSQRRDAFLDRLEQTYKEPFPETNEESLAGGLSNTIAGRICNHFDFHGGGYTVDGACSSSLLAVANACSALAAGDLDVALAGGVDLSIDPFELVGFARTGALASDEMRVFDQHSDGFIPGEGCGFLVLMRRGDALDQGRRIYAVLKGWGISSDGKGGLTRPEVDGQSMALKRAYRRAGFGAETIGLVEGHGTGTAVGDATELATLNRARRQAGARTRAAIGSIKANIGHTKAAAGAASLIKATMALHHRLQPPTTGCETPHPELRAEDCTLDVLRSPRCWPRDVPLRASVSSMGFGGINCHVVLEGADERRKRSFTAAERRLSAAPQDAEIFFLAATSEAALSEQIDRLRALAVGLSCSELSDLAATLATGLPPGPAARAAVIASTPEELAERLDTLAEKISGGESEISDLEAGLFAGQGVGNPQIGFLFPGQASPSHLGGGLWRRRFAAAERLYERARLPQTDDSSETSVAQPAITTASLVALEILESLGVEASVAVGHSLGELTALHWAGAYDRETLRSLARERGRAMSELGDADGAMASLGTSAQEVEKLLTASGLDGVVVTGYNSPSQTVISGPAREVGAAVAKARGERWPAQRLSVSHAFHSPLVEAAVPRLEEALRRERVDEEAVLDSHREVYSTVTGERLTEAESLSELLCRQITSPVRFMPALESAAADVDLLLEVGPGEVLTGLARRQTDVPVIALDAGGDSLRGLLRATGALFALGAPIDTEGLFADRFTRPFDLEQKPQFLVNPCELAPVGDASGPRPAARPTPAPEAAVAVEPSATPSSPLDLVRQLIASRAGLPEAAITDESRLLSDLHLSSIAVGELVTEAARRLELPPPFAPTEYADASVSEVARALQETGENNASGSEESKETLVQGVDSWVRPFAIEWVERPEPRPAPSTATGDWRVVTTTDHPLREPLERAFAEAGGGGTVLCLAAEGDDGTPGRETLDLLLDTARAAQADRRGPVVLLQPARGAAAFFRTLHLESPEIPVAVIELPADAEVDPEAWCRRAVNEALAVRRYTEARYDADGRRFQPVLRLLDGRSNEADAGSQVLAADDVLLVTGGGKGIAAECALSLARRTGMRLALLGRSLPENDDELRANLERLESHGVRFHYVSADVTDADAVRAAVRETEAELGPIRGVLHSAGTNSPQLIGGLERSDIENTLAPKVRGLHNVLGAVDRDRLALLVGFGSIIGRAGLRGEADYALANEALREMIEGFADEHTDCRCLCLEWSVWSGIGMGARLGHLEALAQQGIMPITPERGVEILEDFVLGDAGPVSVVVGGRFGEPPTLEIDRPELPLRRFLEKPQVFFPGIELVVDCDLSQDTDPYLDDHLFEGRQLFPAVLGLEAMAQAVAALTGRDEPPVYRDVRFERPISVAPGGSVTLRVAALVRRSGDVEVALRSDRTGFQIDHFRARCVTRETTESQVADARTLNGKRLSLSSGDLYGPVLFQAGRFRRLEGYRELRATSCLAEIEPNPGNDWFHSYLSQDLELGDPGARDAFIHCIQACIPHAIVLPVSVERLTAGEIVGPGPFRVSAHEISHQDRTLIYDLEVRNPEGELVEHWQNLELRIVTTSDHAPPLAPPLLGPYLERRLQDLVPRADVAVAVDRNGHADRSQRGKFALGRALGRRSSSVIGPTGSRRSTATRSRSPTVATWCLRSPATRLSAVTSNRSSTAPKRPGTIFSAPTATSSSSCCSTSATRTGTPQRPASGPSSRASRRPARGPEVR